MASASSSPAPVQEVIRASGYPSGVIPLSDTILTWQAIVATLMVYVVGVGMAWFIAPGADNSRTAEHLGIELRPLVGRGSFTVFLACFPAALITVTLLAPHVIG